MKPKIIVIFPTIESGKQNRNIKIVIGSEKTEPNKFQVNTGQQDKASIKEIEKKVNSKFTKDPKGQYPPKKTTQVKKLIHEM